MTTDDCSCPDFTSTRRSLLRTAALAGAGAVTTTLFGDTFRQTAYGATDGNVMVVLSLRGGCDTLSLVVPHSEAMYGQLRPATAIPTGALICRDASFGLHPGFQALKPMWDNGTFGAVLATGLPVPNRSHFDAIEEIEDADLASDQRTGWINRLIGLDTLRTPLEAVSVGSGILPTSLYGPQPTLAADSTGSIELSGGRDAASQLNRRRALTQTWGKEPGTLGVGARSALTTTATLAPALSSEYQPANGVEYPASTLGDALKDTARLIKAQVGVEVVTLDYGSWDMHSAVGTLQSTGPASMNGMVINLADSLSAFYADLGATGSRVTLVTLTEFGRRVEENGPRGFDHGWANSTLVMGGGVRGGQYHGRWPGLDAAQLDDGDLKVTTDYRSVLTEIVKNRFGDVATSQVFPGFLPELVGVMT